MFERNMPEEELERLSRAIADAIFSSKDVKKIIEEIREKDMVLPSTLMVMVLKLEALSNASEANRAEVDKINKSRSKRRKMNKQLIDGKELDSNEIAFQEFLVRRFNDKEWLKKNGLVL